MKTLLVAINAKYVHTNLAVRQLSEYAKSQGVQVDFVEYTINNHLEEIFHGIYSQRPDVLGFSCYIWNIEYVGKLVALIKKVLPNIKIWLGGPEVTYRPDEILQNISADFVISGAGEYAMLQLLNAMNVEDYSHCDGLTYRKNGEIISNQLGRQVDMNDVCFAYPDLALVENRICYYEASRGCPFNCKYCLSSVEKGVQFARIEKVKIELGYFINAQVSQVKFVDRTFNCLNDFAVEIVKYIISADNKVTNFHFEVAPELLTDEFMSLLESARKGLFQLEIGVQSTNNATLNAVCRRNDFDYISQCVKRLKAHKNVHLHLDLIAGLPFEDVSSFRKSFNDVHALFPHQLQLGFLKILRGAGMESMCEKYKILYSPYPPYEVLSTHCLSFYEVLYLKGIEDMTERFYNSTRYVNACEFFYGFYNGDYFQFYADLAEFQRDGNENLLRSNSATYEFLIRFAEHKGYDSSKVQALCLLDFISHEKPRSTPSWANECRNFLDKNQIYDFVVRENSAEKYLIGYDNFSPKEILNSVYIHGFKGGTIFDEDTIYLFDYKNRDIHSNALKYKIEKGQIT